MSTATVHRRPGAGANTAARACRRPRRRSIRCPHPTGAPSRLAPAWLSTMPGLQSVAHVRARGRRRLSRCRTALCRSRGELHPFACRSRHVVQTYSRDKRSLQTKDNIIVQSRWRERADRGNHTRGTNDRCRPKTIFLLSFKYLALLLQHYSCSGGPTTSPLTLASGAWTSTTDDGTTAAAPSARRSGVSPAYTVSELGVRPYDLSEWMGHASCTQATCMCTCMCT